MEGLPFRVLIFVGGALLISNAWAVVDTKIAVDAAAREAVRAYVEAPNPTVAHQAAAIAAADAIEGHGRRPDRLGLTVVPDDGQPFARCVRATATTTYAVPTLHLPWIGGLGP